jgi:uncharacterized damage-inducible protein DinB
MIQSTTDFIKYFESIRRRTLNYIRVVPPERVDWAPKAGEFTTAEIIRHFGASERMFVRVAMEGAWHYAGHEAEEEADLEALIAGLEAVHLESMKALGRFPDKELAAPRYGPKREGEGHPLKAWRWLMAMTEHEIHHRSQLAVYLSLMGVQPPHIFGLGVEDLIALSVT